MKKIVCITGTRPQLIKHAVLHRELQKAFSVTSLFTGQHYDYELHEGLKKELFPHHAFYDLQLEHQEAPAQRLGEMIQKISLFLQSARPDAVLVYGDTDTTLAGALAANKMLISLIHVEAGERSYNRAMPEEYNRIVADTFAEILFCASHVAVENLKKEHHNSKIFYSGDLMKDLLLQTAELFQTPILSQPYIFCTIHRSYTNRNEAKLAELLGMLKVLDQTIIFPVHPSTQPMIKKLHETNGNNSKIQFLSPVSYKMSIRYLKFAQTVITDSGGIQKEAYWLKRRCITVRKETEWLDTLHGNWNQLVYDNLETIPQQLNMPLGSHDPELYGTGNAAVCITQNLIHLL